MADIDNEALEYHLSGRPGKIEVVPTKPTATQRDLALAYTPGVAKPCLEIDTRDTEAFINAVKLLEPTFGGINLEDIAAPECFEIEERLKAVMKIPVFHDDQHGTAIISAAALMNALEVAHKDIGKVKVVIAGAGAAAMACLRLYIKLGLDKANVILSDSKGVIYKGRTASMTPYKAEFAADTDRRTLA